jgi:hypothetical protein
MFSIGALRSSRCTKHLLILIYFFRFTSIATLSLIASTYLEKKIGYWAAYLMPLCAFAVVIPLLVLWYKPLGSQIFFFQPGYFMNSTDFEE